MVDCLLIPFLTHCESESDEFPLCVTIQIVDNESDTKTEYIPFTKYLEREIEVDYMADSDDKWQCDQRMKTIDI